MHFPTIGELATRDPVTITSTATITDALEQMSTCGLRDIIVTGPGAGNFALFTANDLIQVYSDDSDLHGTIGDHVLYPLPCFRHSTSILEIFGSLDDEESYLGVLSDTDELSGIVSYSDILSGIDPEVVIDRQEISQLFNRHECKYVTRDTPLRQVLAQLVLIDDSVVVVENELNPVGIITTKDSVRLIAQRADLDTPVGEVMTTPLVTIPHSTTIREALNFINDHHFKRIVVTQGEQLLGVVRQRELVNLAYNRWAEMLRSHASQLQEVVSLLERKTVKLERQATTDILTGIANRHRFEEQLRKEIYRVNRYGKCHLSLLLIDIDRFKQINDTFGHPVGDSVLQELTRLIEQGIRATDLVGRWGGEEFTLLLPITTLPRARVMAEMLCERVAEHNFGQVGQVTISIGIAEYTKDEPLTTFITRCDKALYRAKAGGRNRVEVA